MTTVTASGLADNTQYTFKLMRPAAIDSQDADTVISTTVSVSSGSGALSLDLPANLNNTYYWADFGDPLYTFSVPASGGPYAITDILITPVRAIVRFPVETVNGQTGPDVTISATDIAGDFVVEVNGHSGNVTLDASDVGALPSATDAADIGAMDAGANFEIQAFDGSGTQAFVADATTDGEHPPTYTTQITLANFKSMGVVTEITQNGNTYDPTSGVVALDPFTDTLADLTDVDISSPTDGQSLRYNASAGKWENTSGGAGMNWQGAWDPTKTYDIGDVVNYNKALYIANTAVPVQAPTFIGSAVQTYTVGESNPLDISGIAGVAVGDTAFVLVLSTDVFTHTGDLSSIAAQTNGSVNATSLWHTMITSDITNQAFGSLDNTGTDELTVLVYIVRNVQTGYSATTNSTAITTATAGPTHGLFITGAAGLDTTAASQLLQANLTHYENMRGGTDNLIGGIGYDVMTASVNSTPRTFTSSAGTLTDPITWVFPVGGLDPIVSGLWTKMVQGS